MFLTSARAGARAQMSCNPFDADAPVSAPPPTLLLADVDALFAAPSLDALLDPRDAALLRSLLTALREGALQPRLDAWMAANVSAFEGHGADGEHLLEWSSLHAEYAALWESALESTCAEHGRPSWEVFGLCQQALQDDPRARDFVETVVAATDYSTFVRTMISRAAPPTVQCPAPEAEADEEAITSWPELVGQSGEDAVAAITASRPDLSQVVAMDEDGMMTMDYREDRVRVMVDGAGIVTQPPCVG